MGSTAEDLTKMWEKFNLMEEEDEEVDAPEEDLEPVVERGSACVVGKLLADRTVGKEIIKTPLIQAWQRTRRVTLKTLGANLLLVDFENEWFKIWIMEGLSWTFDGNQVSLEKFDGLMPMTELDFAKAAFWVRMYNLPLACMSKAMGLRIGASVGQAEEVDVGEEGVGWGSF